MQTCVAENTTPQDTCQVAGAAGTVGLHNDSRSYQVCQGQKTQASPSLKLCLKLRHQFCRRHCCKGGARRQPHGSCSSDAGTNFIWGRALMGACGHVAITDLLCGVSQVRGLNLLGSLALFCKQNKPHQLCLAGHMMRNCSNWQLPWQYIDRQFALTRD